MPRSTTTSTGGTQGKKRKTFPSPLPPLAYRLSSLVLLLKQRTLALRDRHHRFVGRNHLAHVIIIPRRLGFLRFFHLQQIEVVHVAAVLANLSVLGEEVVDRRVLHFSHHRFGLIRAGRLDC